MRPIHENEEKSPEVFVSILRAYLPSEGQTWYTTDRLLKEAIDAYESAIVENASLQDDISAMKQRLRALSKEIERHKRDSETYKNLFLMSGGKTA